MTCRTLPLAPEGVRRSPMPMPPAPRMSRADWILSGISLVVEATVICWWANRRWFCG
jgi:hypothetical protein